MPLRILVAVDGSEASIRATQWVADLSTVTDLEVIALHVLGLLEPDEAGRPVPSAQRRAAVEQLMEESWCGPLCHVGRPFERLVTDGAAAPTIVSVGRHRDVDMIVVGTRGAGSTAAWIGSTAQAVVSDADRPVTVVPLVVGPSAGR
jgi:nucleotide-binding universal stress UspA family protein